MHIPYYVGFITPGAPALRVWYGDPTLRGGFWSDYRQREPGSAAPDFFFRFDTTGALVEIHRGGEDLPSATRANPRWARDHEALAASLAKADDWAGAAGEYRKLITAFPDHPDYLFNAGIALFGAGDSTGAEDLILRAARAPGASEQIRNAATMLRSP